MAADHGNAYFYARGRDAVRPSLTRLFGLVLLVALASACPSTDVMAQGPTSAAPGPETLDPAERLRQLEQKDPGQLAPADRPEGPKEKAKERVRELEKGGFEQKERGRERKSPKEKARDAIRRLEGQQAKPKEPARELTQRERARYLLGVYEGQVGIYDEILDRTRVGASLLHGALNAPEWLVIGGEHRTRYEVLDGSWRRDEAGRGESLAMRTRFQVGIQNILDPLRFLVEFQDSRLPMQTNGAYLNDNNVNQLDIQQLHLDLVTKSFLGTGLPSVVKVGRVNMDMGRGRWAARNNFRNATNAFDGLHWQLGDERAEHVRSFLVRPVARSLKKPDDWALDHNTFWGIYFESRKNKWLEYTLHYFGHASEEPGRDFSMLGGRLRKQPTPGGFDYEIESSYQFGNITEQNRFAHFQHGEVGYTFDRPWQPQVLLKFDYAANGFDVLYGRRSFELHPTGNFGPFQRSNFISPGYRVLAKPFEGDGYVFFQHRFVWLADDKGSWAGTGIADPTGRSGNFVAQTFEIRARYSLTDNLYLQAGLAHMAFGPFARNAPNSPVTRDANFGYFWTEFTF